MNYERIYDQFIADRRTKEAALIASGEYSERHHIVPRSMGGGDEKSNLIHLSAEDHVRAHLLLAKAHGGMQWCALGAMLGNRTLYNRVPSRRERRAFAFARIQAREALVARGIPDVCRKAAAIARIERPWAPRWDTEARKKRSDMARAQIAAGRSAFGRKGDESHMRQDKYRAMAAEQMRGQNNPMWGNHTPKTPEHRRRISVAKTGVRRPDLEGAANPFARSDVKERIAYIQALKRAYCRVMGIAPGGGFRNIDKAHFKAWLVHTTGDLSHAA